MQVEVLDTSVKKTYSFYIRAQLMFTPTIFAYSGLAKISVICGTETVDLVGERVRFMGVFPRDSSSSQIFGDLHQILVSSQPTYCQLDAFKLFQDAEQTQIWTDSQLSL